VSTTILDQGVSGNGRAEPGVPLSEVVILGAGASGIATAIKLQAAGIGPVTILEKASRVGGTWRDNIYPGLTCDVPSHVYTLAAEPNPDWSRIFSPQAEILAYLERVAHKRGVVSKIQFNSEVTEARFDEAAGYWEILTRGGKRYRARFLIQALGPLERPRYPEIRDAEKFAGVTFHSARWNPHYDLGGKTVAVVGNAASGVQLIPEIAPVVKQLYVFQRTPSWVLPKLDRPYKAWEKALFRVPFLAQVHRQLLFSRLEFIHSSFRNKSWLGGAVAKLALRNMRQAIADPQLREKLTPHYPFGCKRILFSNVYYPTLARPNVELVTERIAAATPAGLVTADGVERNVDAVIFATGFDVMGVPVPTYGLDGVSLERAWRRGPEAYKGVTIAGFPNMFYLLGPNSGLGHNSVWLMAEAQADYAIACIKEVRARKDAYLTVRQEAMDAYNRELQKRFGGLVWAAACSSWYQDADSKIVALYPGTVRAYRRELAKVDWRHYDVVPKRRPLVTA